MHTGADHQHARLQAGCNDGFIAIGCGDLDGLRLDRHTVFVQHPDRTSLAFLAQGAGGQNVNKVSSAIHLRFDIAASSLPIDVKERLFELNDSRITEAGVLVLKAQQHRTQEMNRSNALARLQEVIDSVATPPKARRATKPSYGAKQRRLEGKSLRSDVKASRSKSSRSDE